MAVARPIIFPPYNGYTYELSTNVAVRNTIIARNTSNVGGPDVAGEFDSGGHNLIGVLGPDATGFVASDLRGTAASPLDPRLLPLKNNGGPTKTHALGHHSPALNAGDNTDAPPTDQRGGPRIVDGIIDIGACEARRHDDGDHGGPDDHGGGGSGHAGGKGPQVDLAARRRASLPGFSAELFGPLFTVSLRAALDAFEDDVFDGPAP